MRISATPHRVARHPALAWPIVLLLLLLLFALAGCGRFGLSGSAPRECIPVHDGDCVEAEEFKEAAAKAAEPAREDPNFRNQWGLTHINADEAYGNLNLLEGPDAEPGDGVTIGILDTGVDLEHPSIAGNGNRTVTEIFTPGAVDETLAEEDLLSHGTAVASVAAGARNDAADGHHGVAWGADIAAFALTLGTGDGVYRPISVEALGTYDAEDADLYQQVLSWRDGARKLDILNLSFGYAGLIDRYSEEELRDNYSRTIATLAQADAEEKVVLVWAAGNTHGDQCDSETVENCPRGAVNAVSPNLLAGLTARIEEIQGHSIAVVALNPTDGRITSFSNRCGLAADFCIAAPGEKVRTAHFGNIPLFAGQDFVDLRGTSFAAPMVAGGLAVMKQLFRDQLSNTDLVSRLYATADKSGFYADTAVYGQGSMDLGAATSPVGILEVPEGGEAGRNGVSLMATSLRPGPALGDGLARSLAAQQIMALDSLGAPFWYRLGRFTAAANSLPVSARLRSFLAAEPAWPSTLGGPAAGYGEGGWEGRERRERQYGREGPEAPVTLHLARLESEVDLRGSHLVLAEDAVNATLAGQGGLSAAAFTTRGIPGRISTVGAALSWRRAGLPLGVRAGWIGERETLLGSAGEGAFGSLAGDTTFVGVNSHADLGPWRVGAGAELGLVAPSSRDGIVTRVSSLATSAFALHATRPLVGSGALRFSVSQPLRVEGGRVLLRVPSARTKQGAVLYSSTPADVAPSGRQMDLAGQWHRPLAEGELRLGTVVSLHPGHRQGADPELTFLAGWRVDF